MRLSWKTIAATAVLVVGVVASVAVAATPKSSSGKGGAARLRVARPDPQQHGAALAKALGVTDAQLQSALTAVRDKLGPPPRPGSGRPSKSDMEKRCNQATDALASELNLSGDKVRASIKSVAKDDVAAAVKAGRLSQDEANTILDRIDSAACLPAFGPPGGPHGGPGCGRPPAVQNNQSGTRGSGLPASPPIGAPA